MRRKRRPSIAKASPLALESLPAPLVYYPSHHGIFLAFAATRAEPPSLCACAEGAVRNLMTLSATATGDDRLPPLDYSFFPDPIAQEMLKGEPLRFAPGLCHRCHLVAPTLRYCHEAEGQRFVQTFGWYINQTYLRFGIHPTTYQYLPEICPPEYHATLDQIAALTAQARIHRAAVVRDNADRTPLEQVELQLLRPRRQIANAMQDATRAEFGHRPIGDHWLSETQLAWIIADLFPDEQVIRHHRPDWLEGLELDLYLPNRSLAIEYQGQQHFHPIKAWGGEEALRNLQARDTRKAQICHERSVRLITIAYQEPLTDDHIRQRLAEAHATPRP